MMFIINRVKWISLIMLFGLVVSLMLLISFQAEAQSAHTLQKPEKIAVEKTESSQQFEVISETLKLTAVNADPDDLFGYAVAIEGDTLVVGAPKDDDAEDNAGAIYIYYRHLGGPNNWGLLTKITVSDATPGQLFGYFIALQGDTLVVGASEDNQESFTQDPVNSGVGNGSAYVFYRHQGGTDNWGEVKKLVASDGTSQDNFGAAVTIDGDTVVVGAHQDDDIGTSAGSAYVYERHLGGTDNWGEVTKIEGNDTTTYDRFGLEVFLEGDLLAVGARFDTHSASQAGSVYLFERNQGGTDNWGQTHKIIAGDPGGTDRFGRSLVIQDNILFVSSHLDNDGATDAGSIYLFERDQGGASNWGEVQKFNASDFSSGAQFGRSLSLSGDKLVVGARYADTSVNNTGAAYLFQQDEANPIDWQETNKLVASDGATDDDFGRVVAIDNDTIVIGTPLDDDDGEASGSVYIFAPPVLADVSIEKQVSTATAGPGQPLTYTLSFNNLGPDTALTPVITDIVPAQLINPTYTSSGATITPTGSLPYVWQVAPLAPGEGGIITITGIINPDLMADTMITNTAVITAANDITPTNNSATAVTQVQLPQVSLSQADTVVAEEAGLVTVTAILSPAQPFLNVTVGYQTADGSALTGADYLTTSGVLTFSPGTTTAQFSIPIVDDTVPEDTEQFMVELSNPVHALLGNVPTATVTILDSDTPPTADVVIEKTVSAATAHPGDPLTYTLTFTNDGPATAVGTVITDIVPPQLINLSYTNSGAAITPTGSLSYVWQVADLAPGEGGTIIISGLVNPDLVTEGTLVNTAVISSSNDLTSTNNSATVATQIQLPGPRTIYLPIISSREETPPTPPTFPIFIHEPVAARPVTMQGEVFMTTTIQIPATLPAGGEFYFSTRPDHLTEVAVDDELVIVFQGDEVFSQAFSTDGQTGEPTIVPLPHTLLESWAGESIVILYRDIFADQVSATEMWIIHVP